MDSRNKEAVAKVVHEFLWPELKTDVSDYRKSCHTCHLADNPNQVISPASFSPKL